jgi:hypothetical protein
VAHALRLAKAQKTGISISVVARDDSFFMSETLDLLMMSLYVVAYVMPYI